MKKIILCGLFLFTGGLVTSQTVSVAEQHLPQTASFAKPFQARLVLSHTPGYTLQLPEQPPQDFEITEQKLTPSSEGTAQLELTVMPFTLQASTFTVTLDLLQGATVVSSTTLEFPITVNPVQLFKDKELREIRNPKVPVSWLTWLLILLALLILFAVLFWWRKRLEKEDGPSWQRFGPQKDTRPCHVIALSQIDALLDSGLWEQKQYKIFYITLSDILREYLQRRFNMDVSADTSAELLRHAKKETVMTPVLPDLKEFLSSGDLVKFAKVIPSETVRNRDITFLRHIIEQTVPPPPPSESAQ